MDTAKINELPDIKVLREAEVAELIGVSAMALNRLRREGQAPARVQLTPGNNGKGARYGYTVAAIREWLRQRTIHQRRRRLM